MPRHPQRRLQHRPQIDRDALEAVPADETAQVGDDARRALRALAQLLESQAQLGQLRPGQPAALHLIEGEVGVGEDVGEGVVDLVGQAGGERAHRGHAALFVQLGAQLFALGDVAEEEHAAQVPLVFDRLRAPELDQAHLVVAAHAEEVARGLRRGRAVGRRPQRLLGLDDEELVEAPAQHRLSRQAGDLRQRAVDVDDGVAAVDGDAVREAVEEVEQLEMEGARVRERGALRRHVAQDQQHARRRSVLPQRSATARHGQHGAVGTREQEVDARCERPGLAEQARERKLHHLVAARRAQRHDLRGGFPERLGEGLSAQALGGEVHARQGPGVIEGKEGFAEPVQRRGHTLCGLARDGEGTQRFQPPHLPPIGHFLVVLKGVGSVAQQGDASPGHRLDFDLREMVDLSGIEPETSRVRF